MEKQQKTLIIYFSKHSSTKQLALSIANRVKGCDCYSIAEKIPSILDYDRVVIGSAVYMGSVSSKLKKYIQKQKSVLLSKPLYLFVGSGTADKDYANGLFDKDLVEHASYVTNLGGALEKSKLGFFERKIVEMVEKSPDAMKLKPEINDAELTALCSALN